MDYPDVDTLPQNLKDTLAQHAPVNIYRMVMHSPGLAPGFFVMADAMFQANSLPPHLRELAILRVGYRYDAPYETHQHVMIAGYAGLSDIARHYIGGLLAHAPSLLHVHDDWMRRLERQGLLDRALEALPTRKEVTQRRERGDR